MRVYKSKTQGQSPREEGGRGNTPVYDILCERKQAEMCRTSGHGSKYIIVMIYEIILLVKYPCAGRRSNDYCYVALIFQSTPMVQIHVCMCITVGVT